MRRFFQRTLNQINDFSVVAVSQYTFVFVSRKKYSTTLWYVRNFIFVTDAICKIPAIIYGCGFTNSPKRYWIWRFEYYVVNYNSVERRVNNFVNYVEGNSSNCMRINELSCDIIDACFTCFQLDIFRIDLSLFLLLSLTRNFKNEYLF